MKSSLRSLREHQACVSVVVSKEHPKHGHVECQQAYPLICRPINIMTKDRENKWIENGQCLDYDLRLSADVFGCEQAYLP